MYMVCPNCNNEVLPTNRFCKVCGTPVNVPVSNWQNGGAQTVASPTKKKHKWIWITGGVIIALVALVLYLGSPDRNIEGIKSATLSGYDYGETIGDALHNWFGGTEEWYAMEDNGSSYVLVKGECQYLADIFEPTQVFVFRLTDDGTYFNLEDAYDENDDPIFTNTGNIADSWVMEFDETYLGTNYHELAIKAAFGDEETLSAFENVE